MILLKAEFFPLIPDIGMIFWTTLLFLVLWLLIGKPIFRQINEALKKREHDIQSALDSAKEAKTQMQELKSENDKIMAQAREESAKIVAEAKEMKNDILAKARVQSESDARRMIEEAKRDIENERNKAVQEVKKEVGDMAITIAEKLLRNDLSDASKQSALVNNIVEGINPN